MLLNPIDDFVAQRGDVLGTSGGEGSANDAAHPVTGGRGEFVEAGFVAFEIDARPSAGKISIGVSVRSAVGRTRSLPLRTLRSLPPTRNTNHLQRPNLPAAIYHTIFLTHIAASFPFFFRRRTKLDLFIVGLDRSPKTSFLLVRSEP